MKNRIILLFATLLASLLATAQYNPDKVNKKAAQLYSKALEMAQGDDFKGGIKTLQEAVRIDNSFADAFLSMAGMYDVLKDYASAVENYEKARAIDSDYFKDYNLPYSIDLADSQVREVERRLAKPNKIFVPLNEARKRVALRHS